MNSQTNPGLEPAEEPPFIPAQHFGPPLHPDELGILGRYRILRQLGLGGMGAVFLAFDGTLDRHVALKIMRPGQAAQPVARERFLREARAAAKVKSDHVISLYDVGETNGIPFIAMEYLQGYPLDQLLKDQGKPAIPQILRIGREVAMGLADAHTLGLVHRDIKPANLWLEAPKGRIKILDFGLARQQAMDVQLTQSGLVIGTPAYMSPEQARGDALDGRSDLFSLGVVLYRMCAGRLPFPGNTAMETLTRLVTEDPSPVNGLNPDVPPPLAAIIHRLLAKKPNDRHASATEVIRALAEVERSLSNPEPGANDPPSHDLTVTHNLKATGSPPRKKRMSLVTAALLGVGLVLALVAFEIFFKKTRDGNDLTQPNTATADNPQPSPKEPPGPSVVEILTSPNWAWSEAENLGPGVNSDNREYSPAVSGDELIMVFVTTRNGGYQLFEARRGKLTERFDNAKPIPSIGGSTFLGNPWLSDDGLSLWFTRRLLKDTNHDIWECRRPSRSAPWPPPVRLGRPVNSDADDNSPALSPDGLALVFSSDRTGDFDIWRCRRKSVGSEWEPPEPLPPNINTSVPERCPRILSDGKSLSFTRRGDYKEHYWMLATPISDGRWETKIIGTFSNTATHDPMFSRDGRTVWFSGELPGGAGLQDVWLRRRVPAAK